MTYRFLLLFSVLALSTIAACGGKVVLDTAAGAGGGPGTGSGGAGTTTGGGGCDAASHTIDIGDFNVSCTQASDCTPVFIGNFCSDVCWCPMSAINVADLMKYQTEAQIKQGSLQPGDCFCPADVPSCMQGQCTGALP
jgi:hypothetical protein